MPVREPAHLEGAVPPGEMLLWKKRVSGLKGPLSMHCPA